MNPHCPVSRYPDMRDEARDTVRALEEATGTPVLVTADVALTTMATIKPAKAGAPAHILRYHPRFSALAEYLRERRPGG